MKWVLTGAIALAIAGCVSPKVSGIEPVIFTHEGATWDIRQSENYISGIWTDAPFLTPALEVRARAVPAFEAYTGCKVSPAGLIQHGALAEAVLDC